MGYDATNYLSHDISRKKVIDFIKMLGFTGQGDWYHFFQDDDYKYLYGVYLCVTQKDDSLTVYTRTPIYCSTHDLLYQNYVMKQIKQYFGGYFMSDYGKNRYFKVDNTVTTPAERGCYAAHFRLSNSFAEIRQLIYNFTEDEHQVRVWKDFGIPTSASLLSNISTTYISSIMENYFRQLYVAILKYSEKKENIISSSRINNYDLIDVSEKRITIEEDVALSKSFQNIHKVDAYFRELNKRIDIKGALSKPYHRRKETLFNTLDRVLEHRHALVHHMYVDGQYKLDDITKDIDSICTALDKVYEHICDVYEWPCNYVPPKI